VTVGQSTRASVIDKAVSYEEAIEESEDSEWDDTDDEKISYLRTKPSMVSRHSLLTEMIHGNDGGSAMHKAASFSSPESRRPRTSSDSRASSPSSTRLKMDSQESTNSLPEEVRRENQPWITEQAGISTFESEKKN